MKNKTFLDSNDLVKQNPRVDPNELRRNLEMLTKVEESGVNVGPNYNLGSPFGNPIRPKEPRKPTGSTLRAVPPQKI